MTERSARAPRALRITAGAMALIAPAVLCVLPAAAQAPAATEDITAELARNVGGSLGPPGGEVRSLVIAPTDPARLYLGTATGHIYVSRDGSRSWRDLDVDLPHDGVVDNLLVHPGDADLVYAAYWEPGGSGGLLRSDDGGDSWRPLQLPGRPSLRAVALAPSMPDRLYIGGIGGVWRSDDGGVSWYSANGRGLATDFVESLAVDPRDPDLVFAGTWRQVYRSDDGGATWSRVYQGMAVDRDVFSLAISPHDPDTVLAGTCNFLYCSNDTGNSWDERRQGLATTHNRVHVIVHHPRRPEVIYAGTRGGLYRSDDNGDSWTIRLGGISVSAVALHPDDETVFVGTEERGVMVGGPDRSFEEHNAGLTSSRVTAFDALPGAPRVLFAARADGPGRYSLHYSTDTGSNWRPLGATPDVGTVRFVRAQAAPVNRVLVVGTKGWWSVTPGGQWEPAVRPPGELAALELAHEAEGRVVAGTSTGLFVAEAGALATSMGESRPFDAAARVVWQPLWTGGPVTSLALHGDRFLAISEERSVRGSVSNVAGAVETTRHEGLERATRGLTLHPTDTEVAYAITDRSIHRSDDGGASWSALPLPWPAVDLRAVVLDPADPEQVLTLDYRGAIYRGHGGGRYWLVLDEDEGLHRAWSLHVSPQTPGYAVVATQGHGLRVVALNPLAIPMTTAPSDDGSHPGRRTDGSGMRQSP